MAKDDATTGWLEALDDELRKTQEQAEQLERDQYERPNQPWVCGWLAAGDPCPVGPSGMGECLAYHVCQPFRTESGWQCSRPVAWGGKCREGPIPDRDSPEKSAVCPHRPTQCQPLRSVRGKRAMLAALASALAFGGILVIVGASPESVVSPGELTAAHSSMTRGCAACHTAGALEGGDAGGLLMCAVEFDGVAESQLCLKCHRMGRFPLHAHGVEPGRMAETTHRVMNAARAGSNSLVLTLARAFQQPESGKLACATCHREHRGRDSDLSRMSDTRCQACHAAKYDSFDDGHPDFGSYPFQRRTRIFFDHSTHYGRHFFLYRRLMPQGVLPDSCETCHTADSSGRAMLLRGFEASCASCHAAQIEDDGFPGTAFISIPRLDVARLTALGRPPAAGEEAESTFTIGQWPDGQGKLTPFMRLLLRADDSFVHAEKHLQGVGLGRLGAIGDEEAADVRQRIEAVEQYAWAVKRLIYDLSERGRAALTDRLKSVLGEEISGQQLVELTAREVHGPDFVRAVISARRQWFPNLQQEIETLRANGSAKTEIVQPAGGAPAGSPSPPSMQSFGNWSLRDRDLAVAFHCGGHADPLLRHWLDIGANRALKKASGTLRTPKSRSRPRSLQSSRHLLQQAANGDGGIFRELAQPESPGDCLKCHTVDSDEEQGLTIHWKSKRSESAQRPLTKFSHAPHLTAIGRERCGDCHAIRTQFSLLPNRNFLTADYFPETNPFQEETSGIVPVSRENCVRCHTRQKSGSDCLTCHNYHVGRFR